MRPFITHFTDNDFYTFTCQNYILQTYPRAEVTYTFFDRNSTRYPKGFDKLLQEQIDYMRDVIITDEEIAYMKSRINFLPDWYYVFLKGYRFDPSEVKIFQDPIGYLSITIKGKWYSTIMWEMPILSSISELMHEINGDSKFVDWDFEWKKAYDKCHKCIVNGVRFSDMGTRRRFSFHNQELVISAFKQAKEDMLKNGGEMKGDFIGTSNVWFAKEFNLPIIGTISHQICSFEECVSGVFECNNQVMNKWNKIYKGNLGINLPDCFGTDVFLSNLSLDMAKLFDGIRIDSGNEKVETEKFISKYKELGIDPSTKAIVYSNALDIDKAIELHKWVDGRMKDSYGIGTHLCADVDYLYCDKLNKTVEASFVKDGKTIENGYDVVNKKFPYSNIVIKLTGMRITETRNWCDCVKLSNNKGKTLGNKEKCNFLIKQLWH